MRAASLKPYDEMADSAEAGKNTCNHLTEEALIMSRFSACDQPCPHEVCLAISLALVIMIMKQERAPCI
jgi:hypothetical protein